MYAIIETGGKQYRVQQGDVIDVELINAENDKTVEFKNVLLFHNGTDATVGLPYVKGCIVKGELIEEVKGPKEVSFKYKRRTNYYRKKGHRQKYSRFKITGING